MEEYIIEINRSLTFQRVNSELRYKPDDPFIRTIVIGIGPKDLKPKMTGLHMSNA